jgi:hypothetical protein
LLSTPVQGTRASVDAKKLYHRKGYGLHMV